MAEESNLFTRLCRLPDSVTLQILTAYCYEDLHGDGLDGNPDNGVFRLGRNWTKLTEVHWNNILKRSAEFWSFIDLSWPIELIEYHAGLSQGTPLKVRWKLPLGPSETPILGRLYLSGSTDLDRLSKKWNLVCTHWLEDIQLGVEGRLTEEKVALLTGLLDLCPPNVKALRIWLAQDAGAHEASISLPPRLMSNLSNLRLHHCGVSGPFSPFLETIEVVTGNVNVYDIFQILSGCQVLKSCTFDVDSESGAFLPPKTWALRPSPLGLPHMRRLKLGQLSEPTFGWLYTRVLLEEVPDLEVTIDFPGGAEPSFLLPARFQACASRAHSLSVWRTGEVKYHFDTQHVHSFNLNYDVPVSPLYLRYKPALSFSPFKFLRRLSIGTFAIQYYDLWTRTLYQVPYLTNIHICGCHTKLSAILKVFCEGAPFVCPQLSIISLEDDDTWKWEEGLSEEIISLQKDATDSCLEHLLRCRADKGIPIQKLILSGYSWWNEGPERWNPLVGSIVLNEDMWTDPW
ncbi:hypothetical protein SISSUDRAFT_1063560 [Sistotremastrum suecicum HHB10207 ss-3]|uniref:F-box domain-containing protein n=1 Tax=Sistotremastrum suecicum HHB10207 ss-3 TaxID=1314776 RepID=A0A166BMH9_9AGAM|nr:hypothetical protein SISSUDRAFT_1063560 [Sistotremastrum suecicum HHB10207 ss-3]